MLGLALVLGAIFGVARLVMLGEAPLSVGAATLLVGAVIAYSFGPTWISAATMEGTYTLAIPAAGMAPAAGQLTCTWLPGRWRVGSFAAIAPVTDPTDGKPGSPRPSRCPRSDWTEPGPMVRPWRPT